MRPLSAAPAAEAAEGAAPVPRVQPGVEGGAGFRAMGADGRRGDATGEPVPEVPARNEASERGLSGGDSVGGGAGAQGAARSGGRRRFQAEGLVIP